MTEPDYEELLRLFNKYDVRYCMVGAYAMAVHAVPRYTKDLDLLVEPTLQNGRQMVQALKAFGFASLKLTPEDFARTGRVVQLGYEPLRVDLLTSIAGTTFAQVWASRRRIRYGRQRVWVIGREAFIHSKQAADRPQDRADLELLRNRRVTTRRKKRGDKA